MTPALASSPLAPYSIYMPNLLLQIDAQMARQLERVVPAKKRGRSRFIRLAIQKALMDYQEIETRKAYARQPDAPANVDARTWDEWKPAPTHRRKRR